MQISSKSSLAIVLSRLKSFKEQKVSIEQYSTDSEIAASILWDAYLRGDIRDKVIVDLGSGTGILGLGAMLLGAKKVFLVEIDKDACKIAKSNHKLLKSEGYTMGKAIFLRMNIAEFKEKGDTVIENPPFGVKMKHADRAFLEKALTISKVVYSLHKSESDGFIKAFCDGKKVNLAKIATFEYPLKGTLHFHTRRIYRFGVSCYRLETDFENS
jgi:putative methylase